MQPGESATAIAEAVRSGQVSARDVVAQALERIAAADGELGAFRHVDRDAALARAEELDAGGAGRDGALAGVPVALKSNMCLAGAVTDCGSRALDGYRPPYTATFVERLLAAGAIPVGSTHMDEFAMGSSGENSAFGTPRNPWDASRVPGGSSSGSAAAVAAGIVSIALGSDTGGSVRQPAAFCGVVGFKPTYGRVSRYGLIAFASSLDQVAPLARSVEDIELVYRAIAGPDPRDATTFGDGAHDGANDELSDGPSAGLTIGVAPELLPDEVDPAVRERFDEALAVLRGLGAELRDVTVPHARFAIPTYYVLATAEASSNLARYDGVRYGQRREGDGSLAGMMGATRAAGFGREVERRIVLGTHVLSSGYYDAWYRRAQRVRARLADDFQHAFTHADILVCPTSPTVAFEHGERATDPVAMYAADVLTVPASLAGLPAISLPAGSVTVAGRSLPVGVQLIGARGADARVLQLARRYQQATGHAKGWPAAGGSTAPSAGNNS